MAARTWLPSKAIRQSEVPSSHIASLDFSPVQRRKGIRNTENLNFPLKKLVRIAGLEPARVAPLPPQSSVSANSTICAHEAFLNQAGTGVTCKGNSTPFRKVFDV